MKLLGKFQSARWGEVSVLKGNYLAPDGPLAIALELANGEPLAALSVNMVAPDASFDSRWLPPDCFYMKSWSENEEIAAEAMESGLFKLRDDLPMASSGFVAALAWQLVGG